MKRLILALLATLWVLPAMAADYKSLEWDNLIPEGERLAPPPQVNHEGDPMSTPQPVGGVVPTLDGQSVRLPGFVVPLEGDSKTITAFLLVPYFGACIHVPPPPTNQVVYVRFPKGAPVDDLWDAIWVKGTMKVVSSNHQMANASYAIEAVDVVPYE
ncbi:DUF3299 domain-containing protein [Aeromonas simiae]|uniref:DUF3299 domain-containing protein n=1 Tax=Aeromonas simiae TaxID=218936 RepID=A0A5J6WV13_9GAMM|nr:DUF3299 domain-containing protein [Aeromonas simiae]MDO2949712.1 DUF3299 domain-containing protein [Aeromonas simiae]MDO2953385.1 DUF3299 domain-containing protein [Aeromonas simiae]MDO2957043.1 DUF3299 domain-containing protein [Aeromonas simiae]QFI54041.1 DUF3299 domain-containing protein [Aeromonas simiae]